MGSRYRPAEYVESSAVAGDASRGEAGGKHASLISLHAVPEAARRR